MNFSIGRQDYSYPQTEENVEYYISTELLLVFSVAIWRRAGDDGKDGFIHPDWKDVLVISMVVTEFGVNFAWNCF